MMSRRLKTSSHRPQRQSVAEFLDATSPDHVPVGSEVSEPRGEEPEVLPDFRHYHLSELAAAGSIEYDRELHVVTTGPRFEEIRPLLERNDEYRDGLPDDWSSSHHIPFDARWPSRFDIRLPG